MNDTVQRIDFLDRILTKQLAWIGAADSKANLLFTIESAMLAVLAALVSLEHKWTAEARLLALAAAGGLSLSILFLVGAAFPRLAGPKGSIVFFGGIASMKEEDYVALIRQGISESVLDDFAKQCHRNAQIANRKFRLVQRATIAAFVSLPFWLATLWHLYPLKNASN